jgi:hypothetical protein
MLDRFRARPKNSGMETVAQFIRDRLAELREQRRSLLAELNSIEEQIPVIEGKIEENERLLDGLSESVTDAQTALIDTVAESTGVRPSQNGHGLSATKAVLDYLADCTGAVMPANVVDAVIDKIKTESKNPRRMLFSTLGNLVKSGKIQKTASGRVRLP